jgi:hypothetical protein
MRETMERRLARYARCLLAGICMAAGWVGIARAHVIDEYWAVTGLAQGDALEIHEQPFGGSRVLGRIPSTAGGLPRGTCVVTSTPSRPMSSWCRVTYGGVQGWVDSRFLADDPMPRLPTYAPAVEPDQKTYRGFEPEFRRRPVSSAPRATPTPLCRRLPGSDELILVCETGMDR